MRLFRATFRNRKGKLQTAAKWYGEFTDHNERTRRLPLFTSKAASEEALRGIAKLVAYHRSSGGQTDPALMQWVENLPNQIKTGLLKIGLLDSRRVASAKTLKQHVDDYRAALLAKGNTPGHADLVTQRCRKMFDRCGFTFWSDIDAASVQQALVTMQENTKLPDGTLRRGISNQTFNFYLMAVKSFARWMIRERRATENPVAHLDGLNVRLDRRHDRRALTPDESRALLDAAANGPERAGMSGESRSLLYRTALETGLRRGELMSLTVASFNLFDCTVTVAAAYSKHRREDVLPLRPDTVELLKAYLATKLPAANAFGVPKSDDDLSEAFRADCSAAEITYRDTAGKVADFHCLRHTFINSLTSAGVSPKVAQSLARHSTISLTMDRYSHTFTGDMTDALNVLPDYSAEPESQRATGTADASPNKGENVLADCLALSGGKQGYSGIRGGQTTTSAQSEENPQNMQETRMNNGESGIRTRGTGCNPYTGLANRRLQPLGHLSRECKHYRPEGQKSMI